MANSNLREAKAAKNDEFYTQFHDIEVEINAYLEYDPDVFRGRTVLLPCDDPEWSNFTRYFAVKFDELGLRKLVSTSYAPERRSTGSPTSRRCSSRTRRSSTRRSRRFGARYSSWSRTGAATGAST